MTFWESRIEYVPTVVWERVILPDKPKVLPIQMAIDMEYESHRNNLKQKRVLNRYMHQHKIKAKLERMAELGEIVIDGDTIKRKVA